MLWTYKRLFRLPQPGLTPARAILPEWSNAQMPLAAMQNNFHMHCNHMKSYARCNRLCCVNKRLNSPANCPHAALWYLESSCEGLVVICSDEGAGCGACGARCAHLSRSMSPARQGRTLPFPLMRDSNVTIYDKQVSLTGPGYPSRQSSDVDRLTRHTRHRLLQAALVFCRPAEM